MIRDWLVSARETLNMSHENVAEQSGISRQYYGMIENGQRNPSVKAAKKIGEVLKVNWTLFFDYEGNVLLRNKKLKHIKNNEPLK